MSNSAFTVGSGGGGGLTTSVNYDGVTQTIRQSTNVSSVTYTSVGKYIVNYTVAYPDALYAPNFTVSDSPTGNNPSILIATNFGTTNPSTTTINLATITSISFQDSYYAILNIFNT